MVAFIKKGFQEDFNFQPPGQSLSLLYNLSYGILLMQIDV